MYVGDFDQPGVPGIDTNSSNAAIDLLDDSQLQRTDPPIGDSLAQALLYVHPDYQKEALKWAKYSRLYDADDVYVFIHRHLREAQESFNKRIERSYFYNYVASVVDLYAAYIYHSPIVRTIPAGEGSLYDAFFKDCDRMGTRYESYVQDVGIFAFLHGHAGVLVDMPQAPAGGYKNEQARLDADHRPYLTMIEAWQIKDWEQDKFGNFEWVKLETKEPQGRDFKTSVDDKSRYFLIWSKKNWIKYKVLDDMVETLDSGDNPLGEVPLVLFYNEKRKGARWMGLSAVRDIADINLAILNWCSLGDQEIAERCLNILTMEKQPGTATIELSQYNVLEFEGGTERPEYLTPGATPLELIGKWIERAKDEIYRLAKLGGSTGLLGVREATSGIAYAFEFNETNQTLVKKAENLEAAELKVLQLVARWQSAKFTGSITYPREFGVEDPIMDLEMLGQARMTLTSETAIKTLEKKVASKMFAQTNQQIRAKIDAEIDAAEAMLSMDPTSPINQPPVPEGGSSTDKGEPKSPNTGKSGKATSASEKV